MLIQIPNLLSKSDCKNIEAQLEQADWILGSRTAGHIAKDVKNNLQLMQDDPLAMRLGEFLVSHLAQNGEFQAAAVPHKIFPPMFNCYQGGGTFGDHIDNAIRFHPQTGEAIRTDVSMTIFLNEPEEYEGGELIVQDTYGEQRVKLAAGSAVLYPSTSLHQVTPVTQGRRLASFFWIQSFIPDLVQRNTLYQLDKSIQSLTAQLGNSTDVTRLSGVYHNLLRQWSRSV